MQITKTSRVRQDFTAQDGEAVFSATLNEGQFSVTISGLNVPSVQITIPPDRVAGLIEFLTLIEPEVSPEPDPAP